MYLIDIIIANNLRKKKNISKRTLGKKLGYKSDCTIYRLLETGVIRSRSRVVRLCQLLDIEPEGILIHPKTLKMEVLTND